MEYCTIYSHDTQIQKVILTLESVKAQDISFEFDDTRESWKKIKIIDNKTKHFIKFTLRKKTPPSYMLSEPVNEITKNILGMYNYFRKIKTNNLQVQEKLAYKIASTNIEIGIVCNNHLVGFKPLILDIVKSLDGLVFSNNNSAFIPDSAPNGIFNKEGMLILDSNGNSEVKDIDVFIDKSIYDLNNGSK